MATEMYKHLILLVTLITVIGLSIVLKVWPDGINRTFSQHVARHKASIIYYILLFSIILPLLLLYIFKWPPFGRGRHRLGHQFLETVPAI